MVRYYEDNEGQVDGDEQPAPSPFADSRSSVPWLQGGMAPWHMWGGTQQVVIDSGALGASEPFVGQTIRVAYKRPETWQWLFHVRVLNINPAPVDIQIAGWQVQYALTVGVGRSSVLLDPFETLSAEWDVSTGSIYGPRFPRWSTSVYGPPRVTGPDGPSVGAPTNYVDRIVAQDIQLQPRVTGLSQYVNRMTLEVSAFFAPKVHIRPDWLRLDVPPEAQFGGSEIEGR